MVELVDIKSYLEEIEVLTDTDSKSLALSQWDHIKCAILGHPKASIGRDLYETYLDNIHTVVLEAIDNYNPIREHIIIGKYVISEGGEDAICIAIKNGGEAMLISKSKFEEMISKFYSNNF